MRDAHPPAHHRHLQPVDGPPPPDLIEPPRRWYPREVDGLISRFFTSPFGMAQRDHERHQLLAEIIEIALRVAGDPTHWDDTLVTALLAAEMPHQPHLPGRDRRQVPDLLRGFIGFCAAERGVDAHDSHDALAMVARWSDGWTGQAMPPFDPWSIERRTHARRRHPPLRRCPLHRRVPGRSR